MNLIIEEGQIQHIHDRLNDLGGGIWIENAWKPNLQRIGDKSLMKTFLNIRGKVKKVSPEKLRMANEVRMWLRVITIAELADESGKSISPAKLNGTWRADSTLDWPDMPEPTEKMWDAFRFLLRKTFCTKPKRVLKTKRMMLDEPLGKWIDTERHIQHEMYRTENMLCIRKENKFDTYCLQSLCGTAFKREGEADSVPARAIPTDGYTRFNRAYSYYEYDIEEQNGQEEQQTNETERGSDRMNEEEKLTAVSDGSYDPISGKAAYAWIITTPGKTSWVKKNDTVRGNPRYMTSYRSELAGIISLLKYIKKKMDFLTPQLRCGATMKQWLIL